MRDKLRCTEGSCRLSQSPTLAAYVNVSDIRKRRRNKMDAERCIAIIPVWIRKGCRFVSCTA